MTLNPYASFLVDLDGEQEARAVLAATPGLLHQALCAMTPEQIAAPIGFTPDGAAKWSPCQIAAHLADCELVFSFRLRQTLAGMPDGSTPVVQPFDQDVWAHRYAAYDVPLARELFRAARAWNLNLIGSLSAADRERPVTHPERGEMTFEVILETMAGHDLNHLAQVRGAAR